MIPVKFDARTWARLASMAEAQGITIAQLIEAAAQRLVTGARASFGEDAAERHHAALTARILALRKQKLTLTEIGREVGYSKSYVHRILTENGHRTYRKQRPTGQKAGTK